MTNEQKEVATRQQKESTGHTPTPWTHGANNDVIVLGSGWVGGGRPILQMDNYLGVEQAKINRDFIIRAVNSHEELLNFVKFLLHDNHIPSTCKKSGDDCLKCMAMDIIGKAEEKKS